MTAKTKAILITLAVGIPAFLAAPALWPPSPEIRPTSVQLPFLIALSVIESLVFGLGAAFVMLGWPMVRKEGSRLTKAAFVSVAWLFLNWWMHGNMHASNGFDVWGLITIDYVFHVSIIIATAVVALWFVRTAMAAKPPAPRP